MSTTLLKPGFLVSLKTTIQGGVSYQRVDKAHEHDEAGVDIVQWETTRKIEDLAEYKNATKTRSAASALIRSVCVHTAFGLLCSEANEAKLDEAIAGAQALADAHNGGAHSTLIRIYVLRGRIASTDEEAVRGLSSEVRGLLEEMQDGIRRVDVSAVREAASRAKKLGQILYAEQAAKVSAAVESARAAAREIVRRIDTDGAEAVRAVAEAMTGPIERARFAFLELEESIVVQPGAAHAPRPELEVQ